MNEIDLTDLAAALGEIERLRAECDSLKRRIGQLTEMIDNGEKF